MRRPLDAGAQLARDDANGQLAGGAGQHAVVAQQLADLADALAQLRVVEQDRERAADRPASRSDAVIRRLTRCIELIALDVWYALHRVHLTRWPAESSARHDFRYRVSWGPWFNLRSSE